MNAFSCSRSGIFASVGRMFFSTPMRRAGSCASKLGAPVLRDGSLDLEELVALPAVQRGRFGELVDVQADAAVRRLLRVARADDRAARVIALILWPRSSARISGLSTQEAPTRSANTDVRS